MYCYKCGCELNRTDHCPNCGADVATYKKIIYTSNYLYNDGLQKAQVRDLTGAILSLKNSLWFNKDNLDARNLLGLIYYEIGETVAALSEWVIAKNINDERLHRKNNLGADYLGQVQASKQTMDNLDSSIERYNHALECCYTGNVDVAVLQLKKVLSVNPHYLRARQLLALLYINSQDYKKAARELQKCSVLDVNNTTTLRYQQEVESHLLQESGGAGGHRRSGNVRTIKTAGLGSNEVSSLAGKGGKGKNKKLKVGSVIKYTADNETIIQPVNARNPGVDGFGLPSWIYGGAIGALVGAVAVGFLIMPARVQSIRSEMQQQVREISAEADTKESKITDLQSQVDTLTSELTDYQEKESLSESGSDATSKSNALMLSAAYYIEDSVNIGDAADALGKIDPDIAADDMSDEYIQLYNDLYPLLRAQILQDYADAGIEAYEAETPDYETAADKLAMANKFEDASDYGQTWPKRQYYLADSYYQLYQAAEDKTKVTDYITKAKEVIANLAEAFPNSEYTTKANDLLEKLPEVTEAADTDTTSADSSAEGSTSGSTSQTSVSGSNSSSSTAGTSETSAGTGSSTAGAGTSDAGTNAADTGASGTTGTGTTGTAAGAAAAGDSTDAAAVGSANAGIGTTASTAAE